jgi:hypothetical protein
MFTRSAFITNSSSSAFLYYGLDIEGQDEEARIGKWIWTKLSYKERAKLLRDWPEKEEFNPDNEDDWEIMACEMGGIQEIFYEYEPEGLLYESGDWGQILSVAEFSHSTEGTEKIDINPTNLTEAHNKLVRIANELGLKDVKPGWILGYQYG